MFKTRMYKKKKEKKVKAEENSNNFETPVSSSEPAPLRPLQLSTMKKMVKVLFKPSPANNNKNSSRNQLGVTYNFRHADSVALSSPASIFTTPQSSDSLQPMGVCRKCKHVNIDHDHVKRLLFEKKAGKRTPTSKKKLVGSLNKDQTRKESFSTPKGGKDKIVNMFNSPYQDSTSQIVEQIKETITVSPYVRNYLERKLKDRLKAKGKEGNLLWEQTVKGLKLNQTVGLEVLELVYNLEPILEEQDEDKTEKAEKSPVNEKTEKHALINQGKTHTIRCRAPLKLKGDQVLSKATLKTIPQSSIAVRKAATKVQGKEREFWPPPDNKLKVRQYFTRNKARLINGQLKQGENEQKDLQNKSTSFSTFSTSSLTGKVKAAPKPSKTKIVTRKTVGKTKVTKVVSKPIASTCPRFTRSCRQTLAGGEVVDCGKMAKPADNPTTTRVTRASVASSLAPPDIMKTRMMTRKSYIPLFTSFAKTKKVIE